MRPIPDSFDELFLASESLAFAGRPMQFTNEGIWLPAPLDVVRSALAAVEDQGLWPVVPCSPVHVIDAGMGDGRLVAAIAAGSPRVRALGLESHEPLVALARKNLARWERMAPLEPDGFRVALGSYLVPEDYEALGVRPAEIDVFLNYPDGSEADLSRFLASHARAGTQLWLLTPDSSVRVGSLRFRREIDVPRAAGAPSWHLFVYEKAPYG